MLMTLRIKNLALVEDLTLELRAGFNAITGETGAGKSIIIGALDLVLGERADRNLIRSGADSCTVEAVLEVSGMDSKMSAFLETNGLEPCEDKQLVLKRTFTAAGSNRQFINGSPAPLSTLAALGQWLVDMHGPHDHQSLLQTARQLDILDAYGKLEPLRAAFAALVEKRKALIEEKVALIVDEKTYAQRLDLLRHQVSEIRNARLEAGEEEALAAEYQRASNAARLIELSQGALELLSDGEPSVDSQFGALGRSLQELRKLDASAGGLGEIHAQAVSQLHELQNELRHYADKLDLDPARLQQLEERLNLVQSLKRKYGASIAEVIAHGEQAAAELQNLEQRDEVVERLNAELKRSNTAIAAAGAELTARRKKVIPSLARNASRQLAELGFKQSSFEVTLRTDPSPPAETSAEMAASGFDTVEFQFSPNPGEPLRPLHAIASSGEMARVMLALKTVLASEDQIPVLIFDEVDANIGGETARVVGLKMNEIARQHQVLCITHLAPVAAAASAHYVVTKQAKGGRTVSEINLIEGPARAEELARMLGGDKAARQHAESLLKTGQSLL